MTQETPLPNGERRFSEAGNPIVAKPKPKAPGRHFPINIPFISEHLDDLPGWLKIVFVSAIRDTIQHNYQGIAKFDRGELANLAKIKHNQVNGDIKTAITRGWILPGSTTSAIMLPDGIGARFGQTSDTSETVADGGLNQPNDNTEWRIESAKPSDPSRGLNQPNQQNKSAKWRIESAKSSQSCWSEPQNASYIYNLEKVESSEAPIAPVIAQNPSGKPLPQEPTAEPSNFDDAAWLAGVDTPVLLDVFGENPNKSKARTDELRRYVSDGN